MGVVFQPARFPVGGTAVHLSGNVATVIWLLGIQDPYGFFFFVGFFSRGGGVLPASFLLPMNLDGIKEHSGSIVPRAHSKWPPGSRNSSSRNPTRFHIVLDKCHPISKSSQSIPPP